MPTLLNKTPRPVAVPLPGGKKLRLAPRRTGEVTAKALEHPPLQALVEAGTIEVVDTGKHGPSGAGGSGGGRVRDQTTRGVQRRVGDG